MDRAPKTGDYPPLLHDAIYGAGSPPLTSLLADHLAARRARLTASSARSTLVATMSRLKRLLRMLGDRHDEAVEQAGAAESRLALALMATGKRGLVVGSSRWRGECRDGAWRVVEERMDWEQVQRAMEDDGVVAAHAATGVTDTDEVMEGDAD